MPGGARRRGEVGVLVPPVGEQDPQPYHVLVEGAKARSILPVKGGVVGVGRPGTDTEGEAVAACGHERQDPVGEVCGMVKRNLQGSRP